jgi:hypothetical protein
MQAMVVFPFCQEFYMFMIVYVRRGLRVADDGIPLKPVQSQKKDAISE